MVDKIPDFNTLTEFNCFLLSSVEWSGEGKWKCLKYVYSYKRTLQKVKINTI